VSWAWPAYSLARLSLQRQSGKASEAWNVPPGGDQIRLEGNVQFVLAQLQPGAKYVVRITPIKQTANGLRLVAGQAVQMNIPPA